MYAYIVIAASGRRILITCLYLLFVLVRILIRILILEPHCHRCLQAADTLLSLRERATRSLEGRPEATRKAESTKVGQAPEGEGEGKGEGEGEQQTASHPASQVKQTPRSFKQLASAAVTPREMSEVLVQLRSGLRNIEQERPTAPPLE